MDDRLTFGDIAAQLIAPRTLLLVGLMLASGAVWSWMWPARLEAVGPYPHPVQQRVDTDITLAAPPGYHIVPTDSYDIQALVLSRARYRWDREADLSPVDLLLGWGPATMEPLVDQVKWSQSGRWGYWSWSGGVSIDQRELERNVANVHIIPNPDDAALLSDILAIRRGDSVLLRGYLVQVTGEDGYRWNSSRSRTDNGDGSCEVLYVTSMERW